MLNGKEELIAVARDALDLSVDVSQRCGVMEAAAEEEAQFKMLVVFHVARARQTLEAIILLCEADLTDQAITLSRNIFEAAVTVAYVAKDKNVRAPLYADYDFVIRSRWIEEIDKWVCKWPELASSITQEARREISSGYARVKCNYPKPDAWSGKSMAAMARDLGPGEEMMYDLVYRILCEKSHNAVICAKDYLKQSTDGILVNFSNEPKYLRPALGGAIGLFLTLISAHGEAWGLNLDRELQALLERARNLGPVV